MNIVETGNVGRYSSLELDSAGNPVISYFDNTNGTLKLAHCNDPYCNTASLQTLDAALEDTSLELDSAGNPVISYGSGDGLKLAHCGDPNCTSASIQTVDNTAGAGRDSSLALDASGNPVISYRHVGNGGLMLAYCDDPDCETATLTVVEDGSGFGRGYFTSLALDGDGYPVISYADRDNFDLKLARCHDAICTSRTLTVIDGDVNFGYSSLKLNSSGNAVISYQGGIDDLKLAVCNDVNCTSSTVTVVEAVGNTGYFTSLGLDSSGNAVIGYTDTSSIDLKLAHCHNAACTSATIAVLVDGPAQYTSLVLDSSGNPVVSFQHVGVGLGLVKTVTAPRYSGSPGPGALAFAAPAGEAAQRDIIVTNSGDAGTSLHVSLNSISAGYTLVSGLPIIDLEPTDPAVEIVVQCTSAPTAAGTLVLNTNDPGEPTITYDLSCVTLDAEFSGTPAAPGPLAFSAPSGESAQLSIDVSNTGDAGSLLDVSLDGISAGYTILSGLPITDLETTGDPVSITVQCDSAPQADGALTLATNDPDQATVTYDLSCDGLVSQYAGAPAGGSTLSFVGSGSEQTIEMSNSGEAGSLLDVSLDSISAGYSILGGLPIVDLATSDGAVTITVQCDSAPQANGMLNLTTNDPGQPTVTYNLNCAAEGVDAPLAETGVTTAQLGRLWVSLPEGAVPPGNTDCSLAIQPAGTSGSFGFSPADALWDVKVICAGVEVKLLFLPITVCIQPLDGVPNNKQVYHNHDAAGFGPIVGGSGPAGFVCGQTRVLSLFTLGQVSLPNTGFAPGRVSALPQQPAELAYEASDLTLSIPKLGVQLSIVGVPETANGWNVTWLSSSQAGYLYGTSYPTWQGNSVLTAHVWNADNTPGPFHQLRSLQHGDRFTVTVGGVDYVYEVRSNQLVVTGSLGVLRDSKYSVITLITCEGFNEATGLYRYRRAVQAVLVSVTQ